MMSTSVSQGLSLNRNELVLNADESLSSAEWIYGCTRLLQMATQRGSAGITVCGLGRRNLRLKKQGGR